MNDLTRLIRSKWLVWPLSLPFHYNNEDFPEIRQQQHHICAWKSYYSFSAYGEDLGQEKRFRFDWQHVDQQSDCCCVIRCCVEGKGKNTSRTEMLKQLLYYFSTVHTLTAATSASSSRLWFYSVNIFWGTVTSAQQRSHWSILTSLFSSSPSVRWSHRLSQQDLIWTEVVVGCCYHDL